MRHAWDFRTSFCEKNVDFAIHLLELNVGNNNESRIPNP